MKNNPSIISFLRRNTSALALSVFLLVTTLGFGQNMLIDNSNNPDFEGSGGFQSNLNLITTPNGNMVPGQYGIVTDPIVLNTTNYISSTDHSGSGKMLVVDGQNNDIFWKQQPDIRLEGGKTYVFSYWVKNIIKSQTNLATIKFDPAGQCACTTILVSGSATVSPSGWNQVSYEFTPTGTGDKYVRIELSTVNAGPAGNDFAIDDLALSVKGPQCTVTPILITASPDRFVCNATTTTISVNSEVPGVWTKPSGTAIIANPTAKTTEVSNLSYNSSNVFTWMPTLAACQTIDFNSNTTMTIVAKKSPQITALTATPLNCSTSQVSATIIGGGTNDIYTWTTTDGNIVAGANTKVIEVSKAGTYTLIIETMSLGITSGSCPSTMSVVVPFVGGKPKVSTPNQLYELCDATNPGDQKETFDLKTKIDEIIDTQAGLQISFHKTQTDAERSATTNPILNYTSYTNTVLGGYIETIHVRVENPITGCYSIVLLDIRVNPTPKINALSPYELCDVTNPGDQKETFDLTTKVKEILGTQLSLQISFYKTLADAEKSTIKNYILNDTNYTNTSNPETLYVRVDNMATACYSIGLLNLRVNTISSDCNLSSPEFEFDSQFNLYPNPTADVLNIQPKGDTVINSIAVYNFIGQLVLNTTETTATINVSGLPKGTYILKIISNNGTTATKFIKE